MKKPKARPTDCGHGIVVNGCTVSFALHVCQGCARDLLVKGTVMPGLVPAPRACECGGYTRKDDGAVYHVGKCTGAPAQAPPTHKETTTP